MVRAKSYLAFTMIELIFAIVIIGITVVSLPMMTQATSRGIDNNFVQEAIFGASVKVMESLSYRWDLNSAENNTSSELSRVLDLAGDCVLSKRPGHIARSCYVDPTDSRAASAAEQANTTIQNLNNAAGNTTSIFTATGTNESGYKKTYSMITTVTIQNFGPSTVGNLKRIDTTIIGPADPYSGNATEVLLRAFSANIGEAVYLSRSL